jgi:hypothetical protein
MDPSELDDHLRRLAAEGAQVPPDFNERVWHKISMRRDGMGTLAGTAEWINATVANPLVILASMTVAIIVSVAMSLGLELHRHRHQSDVVRAFSPEAAALPLDLLGH